jgi:hypothetical protein
MRIRIPKMLLAQKTLLGSTQQTLTCLRHLQEFEIYF